MTGSFKGVLYVGFVHGVLWLFKLKKLICLFIIKDFVLKFHEFYGGIMVLTYLLVPYGNTFCIQLSIFLIISLS